MSHIRNLYKIFDPGICSKNARALRYAIKGMYWRLAKPPMPDPVFIVGCSRSGTTVTYETIGHSPHLLSFNYELPQFWNSLWGPAYNGWESEAAGMEHARPEFRDAAFSFFYQRLGRGWALDKTCINVMRIPFLYRQFPNSYFIYIHRDGRDNVSSLMDGWRDGKRFALTQFLGEFPVPVHINGGQFREWHFFLPPGWRDYNRASLAEVCAFQWITANRMALEAKRVIPSSHWIQLRYEDIFEDPVRMFRPVFERLGVPFDESMRKRCASLHRRPTSIVRGAPAPCKWRLRNREAVEGVLDMIAPLMSELGYDPFA